MLDNSWYPQVDTRSSFPVHCLSAGRLFMFSSLFSSNIHLFNMKSVLWMNRIFYSFTFCLTLTKSCGFFGVWYKKLLFFLILFRPFCFEPSQNSHCYKWRLLNTRKRSVGCSLFDFMNFNLKCTLPQTFHQLLQTHNKSRLCRSIEGMFRGIFQQGAQHPADQRLSNRRYSMNSMERCGNRKPGQEERDSFQNVLQKIIQKKNQRCCMKDKEKLFSLYIYITI